MILRRNIGISIEKVVARSWSLDICVWIRVDVSIDYEI